MPTLLQLNTSLHGAQGHSSTLADTFAAAWLAANPDGHVIRRDLASEAVPHLDGRRFKAFVTPAEQRTIEQQAIVDYSDAQISQLMQTDLLVIGLPLYNLGVPSVLKAYFDHIARSGITFRYTPNGPVGLLADRKVVIFGTRGGCYAGTPMDSQTVYVRNFLNFIGIKDVHFVYAEGLNINPGRQSEALAEARQRIGELLPA